MATQYDWITDSTANPPTPPPANPKLATGSTIVEPYIFPMPPRALKTAAGPSMPIPPGPPSQPTPPPSGALIVPGPQTPPMGPYGPSQGP